MGWVYGLHEMDPAVVREVGGLDGDALAERLARSGRTPGDLGLDDLADASPNSALLALASRRSWDVDKSLEDLQALCALVPELSPIARVLREAEDMKAAAVPGRFHPEEIGLMGIAISDSLKAALPAAREFGAPEARERIASTRLPFLKKLTHGSVLSRWREDDYLWDNWRRVTEAVRSAAENGCWLGLETS
jgi:hypothetical protein